MKYDYNFFVDKHDQIRATFTFFYKSQQELNESLRCFWRFYSSDECKPLWEQNKNNKLTFHLWFDQIDKFFDFINSIDSLKQTKEVFDEFFDEVIRLPSTRVYYTPNFWNLQVKSPDNGERERRIYPLTRSCFR